MHDHNPLAYHITFGTYGTRLHGDERGTVDRRANKYGDPIIGAQPDWQQMERNFLRFPPRIFEISHRQLIERLVPVICVRGGWHLHSAAAAKDHVHTLLTAQADGEIVRKLLKR